MCTYELASGCLCHMVCLVADTMLVTRTIKRSVRAQSYILQFVAGAYWLQVT